MSPDSQNGLFSIQKHFSRYATALTQTKCFIHQQAGAKTRRTALILNIIEKKPEKHQHHKSFVCLLQLHKTLIHTKTQQTEQYSEKTKKNHTKSPHPKRKGTAFVAQKSQPKGWRSEKNIQHQAQAAACS
ncbi:hypothetical protein [Escherichia coli]|uniref:hypothetical protein n=1 Tax=Escherichia coli TaxID=562 RepID=UPI001181AC76|nr:hypothetical protein [Escherichia coli]